MGACFLLCRSHFGTELLVCPSGQRKNRGQKQLILRESTTGGSLINTSTLRSMDDLCRHNECGSLLSLLLKIIRGQHGKLLQ